MKRWCLDQHVNWNEERCSMQYILAHDPNGFDNLKGNLYPRPSPILAYLMTSKLPSIPEIEIQFEKEDLFFLVPFMLTLMYGVVYKKIFAFALVSLMSVYFFVRKGNPYI